MLAQTHTRDRPAVGIATANAQPGLRAYPYSVRQSLAFASRLTQGQLKIVMPDGACFQVKGQFDGPSAEIVVNDLRLARRLIGWGNVGIAEAYVRGEWDSPDLTAVLEIFAVNQPGIRQLVEKRPIVRFTATVINFLNRNSRLGARRNIRAHYDLGNDFYAAWLDPTMTYSSALFDAGETDLAAAQMRKYAALAEAAKIEPHHRVLEIGCGWGGFAVYAAREIGCHITAITISRAQYDFACRRVSEAGLSEKVTIKLQDYRDQGETFNRIVSIEMIEAVGEAYWPAYFRQLHARLAPGGLAGIQVITIRDDMFNSYRSQVDFIRRHVFPGGMLPSPGIMRELGQQNALPLVEERVFGKDYATTLASWRERFRRAWPQISTLGFDERFRRHWEYYLAYCQAGFRASMIDVRQMVFAKAA